MSSPTRIHVSLSQHLTIPDSLYPNDFLRAMSPNTGLKDLTQLLGVRTQIFSL